MRFIWDSLVNEIKDVRIPRHKNILDPGSGSRPKKLETGRCTDRPYMGTHRGAWGHMGHMEKGTWKRHWSANNPDDVQTKIFISR